jgi:hypothetical protein
VSAGNTAQSEGGSKWVADYLTGVFQAQPKNPPMAYVAVTPQQLEEVKEMLRARASNAKEAEQWISKLRVSSAGTFNWQQDYFVVGHNPRTGQPVLREVGGYNNSGFRSADHFPKLAQDFQRDCSNVDVGPRLTNSEFVGGMSGGNISAAGGLCLVGDDHFSGGRGGAQWQGYAKQVCGSLDNAVAPPSRFLAVGHTDEFYKTIPDPTKPPPCNFAIALASPRKALELLRQSGSDKALAADEVDPQDLEKSNSLAVYRELCDRYEVFKSKNPDEDGGSPTKGQSYWLLPAILRPAFASLIIENSGKNDEEGSPEIPSSTEAQGTSEAEKPKPPVDCMNMTNRELADMIEKDDDWGPLNKEIQIEMDKFRDELLAKYKEKYGCTPDVIEVPGVFRGAGNFDNAGALSIFPNLTNGEYINGKYLAPNSVNKAFGNDFKNQLAKRGISTKSIDTAFAHRTQGNLHCSTHAVRYCRP